MIDTNGIQPEEEGFASFFTYAMYIKSNKELIPVQIMKANYLPEENGKYYYTVTSLFDNSIYRDIEELDLIPNDAENYTRFMDNARKIINDLKTGRMTTTKD